MILKKIKLLSISSILLFIAMFLALPVFGEEENSLIKERSFYAEDSILLREQLQSLFVDLNKKLSSLNPNIKTVQIITVESQSIDVRSIRVLEQLEDFILKKSSLNLKTCIACKNLYLNYDGDRYEVNQIRPEKGSKDVDAWIQAKIERLNDKQLKIKLDFYAPKQNVPMQTIEAVGLTKDFGSYAIGLSSYKLDDKSTLEFQVRGLFSGIDPTLYLILEASYYMSTEDENQNNDYSGWLAGFGIQYMLPFTVQEEKLFAVYFSTGLGQISSNYNDENFSGTQEYTKTGLQAYITKSFSIAYERFQLSTKLKGMDKQSDQANAIVLRLHF